jgi:anti-anti-sigma factor
MHPVSATFSIKTGCSNDAVILELFGDLTLEAEELLAWHMVRPKSMEKENRLILNFQGVNHINSGGISVLIRMAHEKFTGGGQLFGCGISPYFEKLFRIVGLTQYIMVYPDEYAILQRLAESKK